MSQLSVAEAFPAAGTFSHGAVASAGTFKTGASLSSTVIICVVVVAFPQSSVAVHVLVTTAGQLPVGPASTLGTVPVGPQFST